MNQITENLWIGDIQDAREGDTSRFDRVVTICQDDVWDNVESSCTYHHFPLADGTPVGHNPGEDDYEMFETAVDVIVSAIEDGETVFVHCHAGQSRSVMACTAALAALEDKSFDEAFWKVRGARGQVHPSDELRLFATRYVTRRKLEA